MKKLASMLASLKLTVFLVLAIAVVLSAGTILESLRGPEAGRAVYQAGWFYLVLGLFALNVLFALPERWPKNRWRIGFAITHVSMLLILLGALVTLVAKREGQMPIWEGEESSTVVEREAPEGRRQFTLPFAIRLDDFQIDFYPGTRRPAMFRSLVTVRDAAHPSAGASVIQMNRPLSHGGFRFFQSSYHVEQGREMSILSVSWDPGQPIVFLGYGLLVLGMTVVFATRLVQHRRLAVRTAAFGSAVALLLSAAPRAFSAQLPDAATVEKLRALPVQHDGRAMPFDTQAREAVTLVTGSTRFRGNDPVALAAGWMADPNGWDSEALVKIGPSSVAQAIGLPKGTRFASFSQIVALPRLREAIGGAHTREDEGAKGLSAADKGVLKLEERLNTLYELFTANAVHALPTSDPKGAWTVPAGVRAPADLAALADRVRSGGAPAHYPSAEAIRRELRYNAAHPARLAWLCLLPAALATGLTVGARRGALRGIGGLLLVLGFAAMTWGLATRWQIAGRIPAANMYESMLFLGWGVGLFGVIALALRQRLLVANAAALGALAMLLADLLPIDAFIHPVMPVLAGTPWLAIHVPIIVISYSVLAMATGLAHMVVGVEVFAPARRELAQRFSELLYWYLHVGSILLITGILTGSIWAASSWGRYWGWDPKEVWSLVAFLAYMAILHARSDEQIRSFGVAASSIAAFWTILMTYLGVNFVLASGLHSYGFGSSNLVLVLAIVAVAELLFVGSGALAYRRRRESSVAEGPQAAAA
jgi:ABC-type transport system involved in cytochrome c biogenesis permease subunit